jgi:hypothetical protein
MKRLAALLLLLAGPAVAAPPPPGTIDEQLLAPYGKELRRAMPDEYDHYEFQNSCCSTADGTAVDARPDDDGGWQVRFRNDRFPDHPDGWVHVPKEAVLHHWANPSGIPIVWFFQGKIRCFGPPNLY